MVILERLENAYDPLGDIIFLILQIPCEKKSPLTLQKRAYFMLSSVNLQYSGFLKQFQLSVYLASLRMMNCRIRRTC